MVRECALVNHPDRTRSHPDRTHSNYVILNFKLLCRKSVCVGKVEYKYKSMALFDFLRSLTPYKLYVLVLCLLAYFLNQLDR